LSKPPTTAASTTWRISRPLRPRTSWLPRSSTSWPTSGAEINKNGGGTPSDLRSKKGRGNSAISPPELRHAAHPPSRRRTRLPRYAAYASTNMTTVDSRTMLPPLQRHDEHIIRFIITL
jgi:hypothetical protein